MRLDDQRAKFDTLTKSEDAKYNQWVDDVRTHGLLEANQRLGDANPEKIGSTWRLRISGKNRICCTVDGDLVKVIVVGNPRRH
jgi:hypothetical protein